MKALLAVLVALSSFTSINKDYRTYPAPPAEDLSAIRSITCVGLGEIYIGSGSIIGDREVLTANHIANGGGKCFDTKTKAPLKTYKTDAKHDLAIMSGDEPTDIPYQKYSCSRFITDKPYLSYGITSYGQPELIFRNNVITATKEYTEPGDTLDDGTPVDHMRVFNGVIAPGMSGGPVTDINGYAHALNNAGDDKTTILYEFADTALCTNKWDQ